MKIALCSSFIPFQYGGYRNIVEWLQQSLLEHGHQVELIYLPEVDTPDKLFPQMAAFRWIDLDVADRIICFRPQSHLIHHPNKVLWFIHHIRGYYDLWDTQYGLADNHANRQARHALIAVDNKGLSEAQAIFTNSEVVSQRLKNYNGLDSEVLYPPVLNPQQFITRSYSDEIVYICRVEHHKRQHLLIEAMQHTKTQVRIRICGKSFDPSYPGYLSRLVADLGMQERVSLDLRWISDREKVEHLADCLAAVYFPFDEDSYGYPSVEASHAQKAILTTSDSGGVLELVKDGYNGFVTEPTAVAIAEAMDKLFLDRNAARTMGENARAYLSEKNVSWSHVVDRLLA